MAKRGCAICGNDLGNDLFASVTGEKCCCICKVKFIGGMTRDEAITALVEEIRNFPATTCHMGSAEFELSLCIVDPGVLQRWADTFSALVGRPTLDGTRHGGNVGSTQVPFYLFDGQEPPERDQGDSVTVWYDDLCRLAERADGALGGRPETADRLYVEEIGDARIKVGGQVYVYEGQDYKRTVESISAMLGWMNTPPRETLEADIRALKASFESGRPETGWQPIATAPQDQPVLTFRGVGLMSVAEHIAHPADYSKDKRRVWICTDGCELLNVTHWQPLPSPPLQEQP